tara:strand:- start:682 stop:912 length:231 start_codon:yes stop_codon:yes gene_type:complete
MNQYNENGGDVTSGQANTGGGGGAGAGYGASSPGGSGKVIIFYNGNVTLASGGSVSTSGGVTYHTFNSSATFTPTA